MSTLPARPPSIGTPFRYLLVHLYLIVLIASGVTMLLCPPLEAGNHGANFVVKMISPQRFHIESRISGPVSSALTGSGRDGTQSLITRQENGRTVIDAVVPLGAALSVNVGLHTLHLRMIDATHYRVDED